MNARLDYFSGTPCYVWVTSLRFLERDIVRRKQKTKNPKIAVHRHHMSDAASPTESKRGAIGKREFLILVPTKEFLSVLAEIFIDTMTDQ